MISQKRSVENLIIISKRRTPPTQNACSTLGADGEPCYAALSITRRYHTLSDLRSVHRRRTGSAADRDPDSKWQDWRDHKPTRRYDAIISVGAFEHFVQKGLDPAKKLDAYREFFNFCDRMLVAEGKVSLQTIAFSEPHEGHPLLEKTFPDSDLPLIWEPIAAAEGKFVLTTLRNDRDHYYRTLRVWEQNLLAHYPEKRKTYARTEFFSVCAGFWTPA
jgi:cyclopropane fatty-acyl-phospholipid synthase-like methyltransferase